MTLGLLLWLSLLATASAVTQFIRDGSFEQVNATAGFLQHNFQDGGWIFTNAATVVKTFVPYCDGGNNDYADCTPYGTQFASCAYDIGKSGKPGRPALHMGTIMQRVKGLTGGSFNVSFAYRVQQRPLAVNCTFNTTFTTTLGSQKLDTIISTMSDPEYGNWKNRTFLFTPEKSAGNLSITWGCPPEAGYPNDMNQLDLDIISLTGPIAK